MTDEIDPVDDLVSLLPVEKKGLSRFEIAPHEEKMERVTGYEAHRVFTAFATELFEE